MPISRILPSHFCIFFCGFSLRPRDAHCFAASSDLPQLGIVSRRRQSGTRRAFFLPPCLSMSLSATFSLHTQLKSWPFKKPFKKADTALFAQMTFFAINGTDIFSQPLPTLGAKWLKRRTHPSSLSASRAKRAAARADATRKEAERWGEETGHSFQRQDTPRKRKGVNKLEVRHFQ